jgi:hypothetical protein
LERLAGSDVAYRWLAGSVPLNYRGLAIFGWSTSKFSIGC